MVLSALNVVAVLILGFGVVSQRLREGYLSPPMIFTAVGLLTGPAGLGWLEIDPVKESTRLLLELTLIIILFSDAAHIRFGSFWREERIALRLLSIGMPVCLLVGALFAYLIFDHLTIFDALLVAAVLTPTDAALAASCINSPQLPQKLADTVEVEAGLNDGLILPVISFLLIGENIGYAEQTWLYWARFFLQQVVGGAFVGIAVAFFAGRMVVQATTRKWMNERFQKLATIAIALLAFGMAEALGSNGFVSAFVAGLTISHKVPQLCTSIQQFTSVEGELLSLLTFMVFGAALVPFCCYVEGWPLLLFVMLFLIVVRWTSVQCSLLGSGLSTSHKLFLAWCGPRGVATVLFGLFVLESFGADARLPIFRIVNATVLASIIFHGLTSLPMSRWFQRQLPKKASS